MSTYTATTTLATSGTGVVVGTPGFLGTMVEIKVSGMNGGDSTVKFSLGWGDGTRQNCDSFFTDSVLYDSRKVTNKVVSVWENVGGVLTEVLSASNPVFTATQLKLDVAIANSGYKASIKVFS